MSSTKKKDQKRRHSFSSLKFMAAATEKEESTQVSTSSKGRRSSLALPRESRTTFTSSGVHSEKESKKEGEKRSWLDILRLKKRRRTKVSDSKSANESTRPRGEEDEAYSQMKSRGEYARVIITELNPQAYYKTLPITQYTTSFEVIVKLIQKYAKTGETEDPNSFYLTEVKESKQGSYSRVLKNSDRLFEVQSRWDENTDCSFALCRAHLPVADTLPEVEDTLPEVEDTSEQLPIRAMIISPSQDSFYNSYPGLSDTGEDVLPSTLYHPPIVPHEATPDTTTVEEPSKELSSYHGISSRIRNSKLITSPSEKSADSKTNSFEMATTNRAKLKTYPGKRNPKYMSFSDPNIETIVEQDVEDEPLGPPLGGPDPREGESKNQDRWTQRQLMQQSINQGMKGIMAKVISETKQSSPKVKKLHLRSHTLPAIPLHKSPSPSSSPSPSPLDSITSTPLDIKNGSIEVRALVCSPVTSTDVKLYPNFVFTPLPKQNTVAMEKDASEATEMSKLDTSDVSEWRDHSFSGDEEPGNVFIGPLVKNLDSAEEDGKERVVNNKDSQLCSSEVKKEPCVIEENEEARVIVEQEMKPNEDSQLCNSEMEKGPVKKLTLQEPVMVAKMEASKDRETSLLMHSECPIKSFAQPLDSGEQYHTQMELVKPISSLLDERMSSEVQNKPVEVSAISPNATQNEPNQESNIPKPLSSITNAFSTCSLSNEMKNANCPGMKRSQTDTPVGRTSVTKLKRPHSFHVSKSRMADLTKDEVIRKAALRGMLKKPKTPLKSREMVADIDDLISQKQGNKGAKSPTRKRRPIRKWYSFKDPSASSADASNPGTEDEEVTKLSISLTALNTSFSSDSSPDAKSHFHEISRPKSAPIRPNNADRQIETEENIEEPWWTKL